MGVLTDFYAEKWLKRWPQDTQNYIDIGAVHSDINMVIANNELMLTAWWFSFPMTL